MTMPSLEIPIVALAAPKNLKITQYTWAIFSFFKKKKKIPKSFFSRNCIILFLFYYIKQKNGHVTKLQEARLYPCVFVVVWNSFRYATHLHADGMIRLQGWCEHFSGERDGANGWFNPGIK